MHIFLSILLLDSQELVGSLHEISNQGFAIKHIKFLWQSSLMLALRGFWRLALLFQQAMIVRGFRGDSETHKIYSLSDSSVGMVDFVSLLCLVGVVGAALWSDWFLVWYKYPISDPRVFPNRAEVQESKSPTFVLFCVRVNKCWNPIELQEPYWSDPFKIVQCSPPRMFSAVPKPQNCRSRYGTGRSWAIERILLFLLYLVQLKE